MRSGKARVLWHGDNIDGTINLAEGLLTKLRDTPAEHRPDMLPLRYLATHYKCSERRMQERLDDAERRVREQSQGCDTAAAWLDTIHQIRNELGEGLDALTFKISRDLGNRNAFAAQKYLHERSEKPFAQPEPANAQQQRASNLLIADIEQEVFDAMTSDDEAELNELVQIDANTKIRLHNWVNRLRKRLADQRLSSVSVDDHGADAS